MAVQATVAFTCTVVETLSANTDSAPDASRKVTHSAFDETLTLNASSNPPATKVAEFVKALAAGAATIDLTALTGTNGAAVDGTGLKLRVLRVKNLGANTLQIAAGASNGYAIGGTRTIYVGGIEEIYFGDGLAAIGGSAKNIDLTGTTTQTSEWTILLG